jgi:hypothetical protein
MLIDQLYVMAERLMADRFKDALTRDIQSRTNLTAWLSNDDIGALLKIAHEEIAQRTPEDFLHSLVFTEVAARARGNETSSLPTLT